MRKFVRMAPNIKFSSSRTAAAFPNYDSRLYVPLAILSGLALVGAGYLARDVLIPIAFAIFMAVLVRPLMRRMRAWRLPDPASASVLVAIVALTFSFAATKTGRPSSGLADASSSVTAHGK